MTASGQAAVQRGDGGRPRAGPPAGHRHRHLEVPALRDRQDHLPDRLVRPGDRVWWPAVYLGCVALLTKILPFQGSVGIAAAVLAAAALFNPLRRRVQAVVDRRFDRARYDAERVVAQFSVQLREQVDLDVLGTDLLGVVNRVLAPAHLTLWLSEGVPPGGHGETGAFRHSGVSAEPQSAKILSGSGRRHREKARAITLRMGALLPA